MLCRLMNSYRRFGMIIVPSSVPLLDPDTYLLTPWSRNFLEKLTGLQLVKISPLVWNTKVHYHIHKYPKPAFILTQPNPVHTPTSHFLKLHLIIILPFTPGSPKWSLSLRLSHRNPVHTSPLTHMRYIPRPSHSYPFYHPHNIVWGVQIMKLLIIILIFRLCFAHCKAIVKGTFLDFLQELFVLIVWGNFLTNIGWGLNVCGTVVALSFVKNCSLFWVFLPSEFSVNWIGSQ
jgi:hypothetical protein